ncbi:MAG: hypothetical protein ABJ059_22505, partial [Hyphomicrobiales bacterium]
MAKEAEEEEIIEDVQRLFSRFSERIPEKLACASRIFRFVGSRIIPQTLELEAPSEIIDRFEAVCLWVRKSIPEIAPEAREQIVSLIDSLAPEEVIVALASLDNRTRQKMLFRRKLPFSSFVTNGFGFFRIEIAREVEGHLQEARLREMKVGLKRLSSILQYAADTYHSEEEQDDFLLDDHYDPRGIDPAKVKTL